MNVRGWCCIQAILTFQRFVQGTCISPEQTLTRRTGGRAEPRANAAQKVIPDSRPWCAVTTGRRAFTGVVRQFALNKLKLRGDRGLLALDSLRCSLVRVGCTVDGITADCFHAIRMIWLSGSIIGFALATTVKNHQVSFSTERFIGESRKSASRRVLFCRGWHLQPLN